MGSLIHAIDSLPEVFSLLLLHLKRERERAAAFFGRVVRGWCAPPGLSAPRCSLTITGSHSTWFPLAAQRTENRHYCLSRLIPGLQVKCGRTERLWLPSLSCHYHADMETWSRLDWCTVRNRNRLALAFRGYSLLAKVPSSWALMCRLLHPEWQHWLRFTHLAIHRWLSIVTGGGHLMSVWLSSGCRDSAAPQRSPDRLPRSRQLSPLATSDGL